MHTQGPWYVGAQNDLLYVINEPPRPAPVDQLLEGGSTRAVARVLLGFPSSEVEANAKLLAAAPDLLEALEQMIDDMSADGLCVCQHAKNMALAAYKKATGRE